MTECMCGLCNLLLTIAHKGLRGVVHVALPEISEASAHCDDKLKCDANLHVGIVHTSNIWCRLE